MTLKAQTSIAKTFASVNSLFSTHPRLCSYDLPVWLSLPQRNARRTQREMQ